MRTLEIKLPDEIFGVLSSLSKKQDKFVLEAIREKLEREKGQNLKQQMIEGYKATAKEDLALTKEFESADLENL
ncbi:MAG: hypothetical protein MUC29_14165 [Pyrinomonadaceae bacterium]|jgi:hypothetical protein|nr:hypothetical protein [Pyrinomonadaceae bacterium]